MRLFQELHRDRAARFEVSPAEDPARVGRAVLLTAREAGQQEGTPALQLLARGRIKNGLGELDDRGIDDRLNRRVGVRFGYRRTFPQALARRRSPLGRSTL